MNDRNEAQRARESGNGVDVSVIIAAWKAQDFIDVAIDSALAEATPSLSVEVLVTDDASPDDTYRHLSERAAQDPRIIALQNDVNGGPSAARNRAIEHACGTWLAVLDADDRFVPGRLARLLEDAAARQADLMLDNLQEIDETGAPVAPAPFLSVDTPEIWTLERWAHDNRIFRTRCTGFLKPLMRRAFLEAHAIRYREEMRNSEDYAIVADCLMAGACLAYEPTPGYLYTRREGSLSHRMDPEALERIIDYSAGLRERAGPGAPASTRRALDAHLAAARDAQVLGDVIDGLRAKAPGRIAGALARRPASLPLILRWVGEALGKRIGLNRRP